MKFNLLTEQFQLRKQVKLKLEQAFYGFVEREMENVQASLERLRNDPYFQNKDAYAVDLIKQLILNIIQRLVKHLTSDDFETAFRNDTFTLVAIHPSKMSDKETGRLIRYHPVNSQWVTWLNQHFTEDWSRFVRQLAVAVDKDLNTYIFNEQLQWIDTKV